MDTVYQQGTTVRLECIFKDFNDKVINPTLVKVIVYDYQYNKINEIVTEIVNDEIGKYHYDFITPSENRRYYYEWYGEIEGNPSIKRDSFMTKFI